MSEKRRDKKGRILRNGEHQRGDGRYQYSYIGLDGKQKCVYSWKLEPTDAFPKGKRNCKSLREKEKEIQKDIDNGIIPDGGKLTVIDLVEKYINQKNGVRPTTKHGYNTVINTLKKNQFGMKRIDKISLSDAKMWIIKLQRTYGKSYGSIRLLVSTLKPAFQMAVDDNYIRKNPFSFQISTVITNDSSAREAITYSQKSKFLEFIKNDKCY